MTTKIETLTDVERPLYTLRIIDAHAWELELPVEMVLAALAAQGLHVVTAADKAVLDAADAWLDEGTCAIRALADAVRARRGAK